MDARWLGGVLLGSVGIGATASEEISASILALNNVSNIVGGLLPAAVGAAAANWGLDIAMWFLVAGPLALLIATPRPYPPRVNARAE